MNGPRSYPAAGHDHAHTAGCETVVRVSCVKHAYEDGTQVDLCGLEFTADKGSRVAILGPNGSGKTTLLFHVLGLLTPQEGRVSVLGVDPAREWSSIRRRIGVVLQNVDEQLISPTVFDDVAFSPRQYGLPEEEARSLATAALELLGIAELADRVPHNLSGGEKRKVALAGALVMGPELLVLDEPFEGLDPSSRVDLIGLLHRLTEERGLTTVMSTHDIDTVPEFADFAYVLQPGGRIALKGTPAEVFEQAEAMARSNIRPPILAELFARLRQADPSAPHPALTVDDAVAALGEWKNAATRA
jgi:cobalt/nickel transport system ATP-binding protein